MRKKISISIDEQLITKLEEEAKKKNLSLSRLMENKLLGIEQGNTCEDHLPYLWSTKSATEEKKQ
jgi:hypothetical protein